ncbi:uncharacterized protein Bfra_001325 [Botrytis fragariae]|uniref:CorA-like transporter domain-containing protein n=1 Tax=Botrytis fragariae TaxID=1964551 RepID=A0A8H6B0P1_9HELO|nr:uncharacterized protein Bfra_001325 [Botrytis fragariae]KAF5876967.1 hypothetical protein Bfra_001325 [Botrytis fragariae]
MAEYLHLDDLKALQCKIEARANNLFIKTAEKSSFQVIRLSKPVTTRKEPNIPTFQKNLDVYEVSQVNLLKETDDVCQIFIVRHDRCWARLNIERALFEHFVNIYEVCEEFWKCVFAFGLKQRENEFEFPRLRSRIRKTFDITDPYEPKDLMYVIRQVELNGRGGTNPWSIRQTAVYHGRKHDGISALPVSIKSTPSVLLIIAPTSNAEMRMTAYLEERAADKRQTLSWNLHRLVVSDSLSGWPDYMASLEARLREQTNLIICAPDDMEEEPSSEHGIGFGSRQELKVLEDFVLDLLMILRTKVETITGLRDQCKEYANEFGKQMEIEERASHYLILREFDEYVKDAESYLGRAKDLRDRIQSTVTLLSDFLNHEENKSMHHLTERSTKDAAAVKILTIITLVYLPTTIVANFFSTQFVQTSDSGHMTITENSWILAAISIPLTALTIILWWAWVYLSEVKKEVTASEKSDSSRQDSFRSFISSSRKSFRSYSISRNRLRKSDIEAGVSSHVKSMAPPPLFRDSGVGTWSTTATTIKSG